MLQKPETYEEAKKIIEYSAEKTDLIKRNKRIMKLQSGLLTAIGVGTSALLGILTESPEVFVGTLPVAGLISLESIMPYFIYCNNNKKIKNGTYFEGKSEEKIIDLATKYVEGHNELEREGKIK